MKGGRAEGQPGLSGGEAPHRPGLAGQPGLSGGEAPHRPGLEGQPGLSGGEALWGLLGARGVDCLFATPGSEFGPLIEAAASGRPGPRPVGVAHEFLAVSMAHGHYLGSGRVQAVMVHVNVGAAMASGALINADRSQVPLLFLAGRTPITEAGRPGSRDRFIHWAQESFDQAGAVREWLRWDGEVRDPAMLPALLDRALAVARTAPEGPAALVIPRELLVEEAIGLERAASSVQPPARPAAPEPGGLREVAGWILEARAPLAIASRLGRDPGAVAALVRLADRTGLRVATPHAQYVNFPARHPAHLGYAEHAGLDRADLVLALDEDVPWMPALGGPRAEARVVQVGPDPLFRRLPVRTHRADLALAADPRLFLEALLAELEGRPAELEAAAARARAAWAAAGPPGGVATPTPPAPWGPEAVAAALARAWRDDFTLFNELSLPPDRLPLTDPGQYFRAGSGSCLGWGLGAALGFKLARPERVVIAAVGDGAYLFANPLACHQAAAAHGLPTLTVVLQNGGHGSIREATRRFRPEGAAATSGRFPFADLGPLPRLDEVLQACGGLGLRAASPETLEEALARGLEAVRGGTPALIAVELPGA